MIERRASILSDKGKAEKPKPCPISTPTLSKKSDQSFDPYDYGKEDGIGLLGASVHIMRSTIGSGILMMPYAMKNLGCLTGTILIIFVGLLYYHNLHILVSTEYHLCKLFKVKRLSLVGVTKKSFQLAPYPINKFGPLVIFLIYLYLSIPTAPATYLIVISSNIRLMANFFDVELDNTWVITAIIVPFTLFCQMRRILKILVPFSSISNIFTFVMAGVLVACSIIYRKADVSANVIGDLYFIPKGFAMFILSIRCTGIILPVKNSMKNPKRFSGLTGSINVAGLSIIFIYYSFALICYLNYGEEVHENILTNLPSKNYVSFVTYLLYTSALAVTYILAFFICFDCFWSSQLESYLKDGLFKTILESTVRIAINVVAYFLAVYVPQISLIAAMAGTLGIIIEIALPAFLQMLVQLREKQKSCITIFKDLFIIAISGVLFCMSTARCIRDMIKLYSD